MILDGFAADPAFWLAGSLAMALFGLSKGGFAGLAALGLPIFALAVPPMQAAAIMLPVLMAQDAVSLWAYRKDFDRRSFAVLLAGAVAGTIIATWMVSRVPVAAVTLMVGLIALGFGGQWWVRRLMGQAETAPRRPSTPHGLFWGGLCGITSFIAHVGGPAAQVHLMPQKLKPATFAGTLTWLFAMLNIVKVFPYVWLGQFTPATLKASALLMPIAALATFAGVWLVRRMPPQRFYPVIYALLVMVGIKLCHDGIRALIG
jgi:uncharacterized membrane protein YfcA